MTVWIGAWLLSACSNLDGQCLIKGQFTNMSQGEMVFYMPDGPREKFDTVSVREGKFTYAIPDVAEGYSIMVLPNWSEQVIFIEPDLTVEIEANATQLKAIKIAGGKANKLMSKFRSDIMDLPADQIKDKALEYIHQNPASIVSIYLLKKYFVNVDNPNLNQIHDALTTITQAQPDQPEMKLLLEQVVALINAGVGKNAPNFDVTDYEGKRHQLADYKGKNLLLIFGATWAEGYRDQLRSIHHESTDLQEMPEIINVVLDVTKPLFRSTLRDSVPGANVSELMAWKAEIVKNYQIKTLPTYILIDKNQKIVERVDNWNDIKKKLK